MKTPRTLFIIEPVDREERLNARLAEAAARNECPVQLRTTNGFIVVLLQDMNQTEGCDCPACSGSGDIASMFGFGEPIDDELPPEDVN